MIFIFIFNFIFVVRKGDLGIDDFSLKWEGRKCCINLYVLGSVRCIKKDNLFKKLF